MSNRGLEFPPAPSQLPRVVWLVRMNDAILRPLIEASGEAARAAEIERVLVVHGIPAMERALARHDANGAPLEHDDRDELRAIVSLRLVEKLQAIALSEDDAVANFDDYVAILTSNARYDLLRRRFPERNRLKVRLRYLFARSRILASWPTRFGAACGLRVWSGRADLADELPLARAGRDPVVLDAAQPERAVTRLARLTGMPFRLELLVDGLVRLWKIEAPSHAEPEPELAPNPASRFESRASVERLWREILELPPLQRSALLLHLRDPDGVNIVALMVVIGVATEEEVAAALNVSVDELGELWSRLPLDDLTIGRHLGRTRQQIINLRKSARVRLNRRMRSAAEPPARRTE